MQLANRGLDPAGLHLEAHGYGELRLARRDVGSPPLPDSGAIVPARHPVRQVVIALLDLVRETKMKLARAQDIHNNIGIDICMPLTAWQGAGPRGARMAECRTLHEGKPISGLDS
jgi:hypothetical protein